MTMQASTTAQAFLEQDLLSKSPEDLLIATYDLAIRGCRRQNRSLVRDVLTELIAALDFNQPVAGNFLVLYDYALREVRENRFEQPEKILTGLRDAWKEAFALQANPAREAAEATR